MNVVTNVTLNIVRFYLEYNKPSYAATSISPGL